MVAKYLYVFWINCLFLNLLEAQPLVEATIDSYHAQAHFPLNGSITITHQETEKIDENTFQLDGQPLDVLLVRHVPFSSHTLMTIYSFQLPAKDKGLYILPSVSVKIDKQVYHSLPTTYEIQESLTPPPSFSSQQKNTTPSSEFATIPLIFRLEAQINGPSVLYPGQRTKLFYRISYNRNIDLSESNLPMIHPSHFQKIGDVQIKDFQENNLTIQELEQEIEASEIGNFTLGPSSIEGYAYTLTLGDQKDYNPSLLKTEAPAITIQVKPFPNQQQPLSFTGALGQIQVEAKLLTPPSVAVGDPITLQVKLYGINNLTDLRLPNLDCQPGFSGFFQSSDLPPLARTEGDSKIFTVVLRPLSTFLTQIPSFEVSSFDPVQEKYIFQSTQPLKLNVYSHLSENISQSVTNTIPQDFSGPWPIPTLSPLEIETKKIVFNHLTSSEFFNFWVIWLLPIGGLLLTLQYYYKQWRKHSFQSQLKKSEHLLSQAYNLRHKPQETLHLIEQAFWWRLWEKGHLNQNSFHLNQIPQEGHLGQIRMFILQLQTLQYSSNKSFDFSALWQQTNQLFKQI